MPTRHLLLALGIAAVWGFNFVVIDVGLAHFPPLLLSALRFLVAAVPAIFFFRSPGVPWRWVAAVTLTLAILQFALMFTALDLGMPPGLSSLVLQTQAPFTLLFAVLLLKERLTRQQVFGMAVALGGIAMIALDLGKTSPLGPFLLILGGAASWAVGNIAMRRAAPPDSLRFMVWVSALATLPMFALSAVTEGPPWAALRTITWPAAGAVLYIGVLSTVVGFGVWGFLIRTYSASKIAPFSLLVPVFGMTSAALLLGERITPLRIFAAVLIIAGILAGLIRSRTSPPARTEPRAVPPASGPARPVSPVSR
jgi:O-acetylserine/cysteine efflux transporter